MNIGGINALTPRRREGRTGNISAAAEDATTRSNRPLSAHVPRARKKPRRDQAARPFKST